MINVNNIFTASSNASMWQKIYIFYCNFYGFIVVFICYDITVLAKVNAEI